ncbi:MAG: hypothetical protein AB2A00_29420 [Myxococcota bacterium]
MSKPIGILYEHPEWFIPLFAELDRRGLSYERILAHELSFDPSARSSPYSVVVNRMSPSSYLRGHGHAIFAAQQYLGHLESVGVPVVNGTAAYGLELSKSLQLSLLAKLGIPHPRSRVVNHVDQIVGAALQLSFPVMVKPNIGGSGALMRRFGSVEELRAAHAAGELNGILGVDATAIVQEYHPLKGGSIVRVEVLDNRQLYAIRIHNDPDEGFNLCPADICQVPAPAPTTSDDDFAFCAAPTAGKKARKIEATTAPDWVVDAVLRATRAGGLDVGGVEYLESERDGQIYIYDINSLSNFVTDAPRLVGFDPFVRFVDYIERRAGLGVRSASGVHATV